MLCVSAAVHNGRKMTANTKKPTRPPTTVQAATRQAGEALHAQAVQRPTACAGVMRQLPTTSMARRRPMQSAKTSRTVHDTTEMSYPECPKHSWGEILAWSSPETKVLGSSRSTKTRFKHTRGTAAVNPPLCERKGAESSDSPGHLCRCRNWLALVAFRSPPFSTLLADAACRVARA